MERIGLPLPWGIVPTQRLLDRIVGADPAAGVEWSLAVPGGELWFVYHLEARLVTSAVVATRRPRIDVDLGGDIILRVLSATGTAASTTNNYAFTLGMVTLINGGVAGLAQVPWPPVPLVPGTVIRSATELLDAGDNWGAPFAWVAKYQMRGLERALERYERALASIGAAGG